MLSKAFVEIACVILRNVLLRHLSVNNVNLYTLDPLADKRLAEMADTADLKRNVK